LNLLYSFVLFCLELGALWAVQQRTANPCSFSLQTQGGQSLATISHAATGSTAKDGSDIVKGRVSDTPMRSIYRIEVFQSRYIVT
jgi:hypothetical protein